MNTFWNMLLTIGAFAGLTFIAALLLFLPGIFSRVPLRRHRLLPVSVPDEPESEQPEFRKPSRWRLILTLPIAFPFAALLSLVVLPIIFAMVLIGLGVSYRHYRYLAYRALRRHQSHIPSFLSFWVGLRVLIARPRS